MYSIEQIQSIVKPIAEKYRLPAVYLFGSYARGTQREDSDIDFLVDTTGTELKGLFALGGLYADLEEAFRVPVDMVTLGSVQQPPQRSAERYFKENVMRERKMIYADA